MSHASALPIGTVLANDYRIERVLGAGGFGITYLADEMALQRQVTIKEYFPTDFAARAAGFDAVPRSENSDSDYQWGLDRFIEEAQTLAKFDHRNIVKVYRYFRAHRTGYMVLHFEEGHSLKMWLKSLGRAPRQKELDHVLAPILDALAVIHAADFLHRDIAPDNIIVRKDGSPVLIDFGSARGEIAQHSRTLSALVKPGYSPYEQYSETGHRQGPWTDIYAMGATLYYIVSGRRPPDAPSRVVKDDYVPAGEVALSAYRPGFLRAIDRALAIDTERRPQSIAAWRGDLLAPEPQAPRGGWLKRGDSNNAAEHETPAPIMAASLAGALAEAVPPVPDAPGRQGGFLDFVDGLKKQSKPHPDPTPTVALDPAPRPPAAEPAAPSPKEKPAPKAKPAPSAKASPKSSPPATPAPQPVARKTPRPRPIRVGRTNWLPLLMKLAIGIAFTAAVVQFQDRLPRFEFMASNLPTSQTGDLMLLGQLKGHAGGTSSVAYTEDGRSIVTVGADSALRIWSATTGSLQRAIALEAGSATSLAINGRRAITGHKDGAVVMWDLDDGRKLAAFKRNDANIWSVAFAGGQSRILASSHDWSVALWDTKAPSAPIHVFEGHESAAQAVAFSPAGSFVASGGADRVVKLWSAQNLNLVRTYRGHRDFVTAVTFSPDGRMLASGGLNGSIRLSSTSSSTYLRSLNSHKGRIGGLAFSPTGELLASGGDDGTVRLWDYRRGKTVRTYGGGGPAVRAIAFAPDGKRLAAASEDGSVRLWSGDIPPPKRSSSEDD